MTDGDGELGRLDERAAALVRAELARILASDAFRAAPQLSAFLSFIVERTIEGRATELKGYTIAVEGLGRPADFNPQIDPIVRVEAGRLRRALTQYYVSEGQASPVLISMPVGGYVPVFEAGDAETGTEWRSIPAAAERGVFGDKARTSRARRSDHVATRRWALATAVALALGLFALGWWYLQLAETPTELASEKSVAAETAAGPRTGAAAPTLLRVAIVISDVPADPRFADSLRRFSGVLVDAMARFDDLVTIKAPPPGAEPPADADYVFEMSVQRVDTGFEALGRLRAVRDGRIVWTASSGRNSIDRWQESEISDMARRVATRLMEPFGIIPVDARQFPPSAAIGCVLQAFDARRSMVPDDYRAAYACLEKLVAQEPRFYPAWAQLAFLALGEYGLSFSEASEGRGAAPLDRALAAATAAIRLAPSGARAYQAMAEVLLARGAADEAIQKGQWALTRNPYDPDIMASLGALYVRRGRPSEGVSLLERAAALSIGRPPRYDFYAFLGAYLNGSGVISDAQSAALSADRGPLGRLAEALRAASAGDEAGLATSLAALREKSPFFARDPRAFFVRRGFSDEVTQKILTALRLDKQ